MTLHTTMLSSTEPKNVGSKSILLLCLFCFRGRGGVIGFVWKNIWIYWHIWLLIYLFFYLTVLALLLTVVLSFLFIMAGMYGELEQIGVTFSLLISIQVYYNIHHIKMILLQVAKFKCFTFISRFYEIICLYIKIMSVSWSCQLIF